MTVFNLGSINIDHFYRLSHLPAPGETLAATGYHKGLGGKGANQSVAALQAGARVVHIGAIGMDDPWIEGQLLAFGLGLEAITRVEAPTGHAIVATDRVGENAIIIHSGANLMQSDSTIERILAGGRGGDILLVQNETSHQVEAARLARAQGMRVFYSAAPFALEPLRAILPHATHLLVNALEAEALVAATGKALSAQPVEAVIVTRGAQGAEWVSSSKRFTVPALPVTPVDTTGAGDCFAGSLAAGIDRGLAPEAAMLYAAAAAALQVTRPGTAEAMPSRTEVEAFAAAQ